MHKIAIIIGTSRAGGNTRLLVDEVAKQTGAKVFDINNYDITPYDYDHANRDDDYLPLMKELMRYDHIAFASPIYWYSPSAQMKLFIDRFSDFLDEEKDMGRKLRGQHCSIISTCVDDDFTDSFEDAFAHTFEYLGMIYKGMLLVKTDDPVNLSDHTEKIGNYLEQIK